METALIQYVGKKSRKADNVRNTGRVWEGEGSIIRVPLADAGYYVAHPMIWRQVTEAEGMAYAESVSDTALSGILLGLQGLSQSGLVAVINAARERMDNPPEQGVTTKSVLDAESHRGQSERIQTIAAAMRHLDLKYDDHASPDGIPHARAIQDQCGILPSVEEIKEAMLMLGLDPAKASRVEAIRVAISLMEKGNLDHFTTTGRPRVDKVRELTGIADITSSEITEAT